MRTHRYTVEGSSRVRPPELPEGFTVTESPEPVTFNAMVDGGHVIEVNELSDRIEVVTGHMLTPASTRLDRATVEAVLDALTEALSTLPNPDTATRFTLATHIRTGRRDAATRALRQSDPRWTAEGARSYVTAYARNLPACVRDDDGDLWHEMHPNQFSMSANGAVYSREIIAQMYGPLTDLR